MVASVNAAVILDQVGHMLNDMEPGNQHVRWPEAELMNYMTEGIAAIALARPSLFLYYDNINLRPGMMQRLDDPWDKLVDIHFNINPDGTDGPPVFPGVHELQQYFTKGGCPTNGLINTFYMLHGANRIFEVSPAVPANLTYKGKPYTPQVRAAVVLRPDVIVSPLQLLNFPDTDAILYQGAIIDWTLYRVYSKDQESQLSLERSKLHFAANQAYVNPPVAGAARPASAPPRRAA